jgi:tetratricopeptide (TPR) repeat protein
MSLKKVGRAIEALNKKDIKQAAVIFDSVRGKLSMPQHLHACAVTYLQSGRPVDAQKMMRKLLTKVQPTSQLLSLSGDINKARGDLTSAIIDYRKACKLSPNSPELYYNLALALFENQELPKTREVLNKALSFRPAYTKALVLMGRCLSAMDLCNKAEEIFQKAIEAEPNNFLPYYRLGRLYTYKGRSKEANKSLKKSLDLNPKLTPSREAMILNSIYSGNNQEASSLIQSALSYSPTNESIISIATDWMIENRQEDPYRYYEKAWKKNPSRQLFTNFINCLISAKEYKKAGNLLNEWKQNIGKNSTWESAHLKLMDAEGRSDEVLNFVKLSKYRPKHQIQECLAHFALGNYSDSYSCAIKLNNTEPRNQYYLALLVTALRCLDDKKYLELADYDKLILQSNLDLYGQNAKSQNERADLITHLNSLHITDEAPVQQSVKFGTQTPGNLFAQSQHQVIRNLKASITKVSFPFFSNLMSKGLAHSHPIITNYPDQPYFHASWSIRTRQGGFHRSHIHSKGWYSSACYIDVPRVIDDSSNAGYLQIGKPPFKTKDELQPDFSVKPTSGSLVLFPSYLWHATQPYQGEGDRLVVAFDIGTSNQFV